MQRKVITFPAMEPLVSQPNKSSPPRFTVSNGFRPPTLNRKYTPCSAVRHKFSRPSTPDLHPASAIPESAPGYRSDQRNLTVLTILFLDHGFSRFPSVFQMC